MDLESSIDDAVSLKAVKSRGSESNLSGSELEANYASSGEDILSSKDSLNSIPSVKVFELIRKRRNLECSTLLRDLCRVSTRNDRRKTLAV